MCEWATAGERAGAWIQLNWSTSSNVSEIVLFDRPNAQDHIRGGTLTFSDGSSVRGRRPAGNAAALRWCPSARARSRVCVSRWAPSAPRRSTWVCRRSGYGGSPPTATAPTAPSGLTAVASSSSQINLSWTDTSSNESGFRVERATGGGAFAVVQTVGANVTSFSSTGLTASTAYSFRVRAFNSTGDSAYSNVATATTSAAPSVPAAPTGLVATASSSSQIGLTWVDNANNETNYRIERSTNGTTFTLVATIKSNTTSYNATGLTASTTYSFRSPR